MSKCYSVYLHGGCGIGEWMEFISRQRQPFLQFLDESHHIFILTIQDQNVVRCDDALDVLQVHDQSLLSAQDGCTETGLDVNIWIFGSSVLVI